MLSKILISTALLISFMGCTTTPTPTYQTFNDDKIIYVPNIEYKKTNDAVFVAKGLVSAATLGLIGLGNQTNGSNAWEVADYLDSWASSWRVAIEPKYARFIVDISSINIEPISVPYTYISVTTYDDGSTFEEEINSSRTENRPVGPYYIIDKKTSKKIKIGELDGFGGGYAEVGVAIGKWLEKQDIGENR